MFPDGSKYPHESSTHYMHRTTIARRYTLQPPYNLHPPYKRPVRKPRPLVLTFPTAGSAPLPPARAADFGIRIHFGT